LGTLSTPTKAWEGDVKGGGTSPEGFLTEGKEGELWPAERRVQISRDSNIDNAYEEDRGKVCKF